LDAKEVVDPTPSETKKHLKLYNVIEESKE
jgi:hypothetical protein